ncbi:ATP synthase peripheral stalk subunit OSCP [Aphelenchoides fujianensis]|nr:ATP synthase peripheral stalk subunit OSCP [Aphelenchoides fujianensis]
MSASKLAGVPRKYATSLYHAAKKLNKLDAVEKDVKIVKDLYAKDQKFSGFVKNPTLNRNLKQTALKSVLGSVGVSAESQKFFGVLAENGRLGLLNEVLNNFDEIVRANRGDLSVQVVSADELNSSTKKAIGDALAKSAKNVQIAYEVRPDILGGLIVQIGDRRLDLSIASRVKKLTETIKESV